MINEIASIRAWRPTEVGPPSVTTPSRQIRVEGEVSLSVQRKRRITLERQIRRYKPPPDNLALGEDPEKAARRDALEALEAATDDIRRAMDFTDEEGILGLEIEILKKQADRMNLEAQAEIRMLEQIIARGE